MVKVVGIEKVDYVSNKTGNRVEGSRLHCLVDGRRNVEGHSVESFFVTKKNILHDRIGSDVKIGGLYDLFYNRYGNVEDIRPVADSGAAPKKEA